MFAVTPDRVAPPWRSPSIAELEAGPLAAFVRGPVLRIEREAADVALPEHDTVIAAYKLQDIADYRAALRRWFAAVRIGGHLIVVVPHAFLYERQDALPSRLRPAQRRLYTPAALLGEVEEALVPNSYRVRALADDDAGYDYAAGRAVEPVGQADIMLVLERIVPPDWDLSAPIDAEAAAPDFAFDRVRTRIETCVTVATHRLLVLKLDHLGDFIMGIPALRRLRATFPASEITLVVGSWNAGLARDLGIADQILTFDIYPRNSSEEEVDVRGKTALFAQAVGDDYDLAIDLRSDPDTRFLLRTVRAGVRAGMGTHAEFPFLDIFLPVDLTRHEPETARDETINHHAFSSQRFCTRTAFHIACAREDVRWDQGALVWGPYRRLRAGRYLFEPHIELDEGAPGLLSVDVGIDGKWATFAMLPSPDPIRLSFDVALPDSSFECRVWAVDGEPPLGFRFYGGRLIRQGAASVLHQSEYLSLLIELVAMRTMGAGLLRDAHERPA